MKLHTSGEDYLKTIYTIQKGKGTVRSVDVAEHTAKHLAEVQEILQQMPNRSRSTE